MVEWTEEFDGMWIKWHSMTTSEVYPIPSQPAYNWFVDPNWWRKGCAALFCGMQQSPPCRWLYWVATVRSIYLWRDTYKVILLLCKDSPPLHPFSVNIIDCHLNAIVASSHLPQMGCPGLTFRCRNVVVIIIIIFFSFLFRHCSIYSGDDMSYQGNPLSIVRIAPTMRWELSRATDGFLDRDAVYTS